MSRRVRLLVNLAAVALLGVVMVGWLLTRIVGSGALERPFTVTAHFADSGGVFTDQQVTYRGVLVGRVGELELTQDGVAIELLIDPAWEGRIPADVTASVAYKSAVGEQYVDLVPRSEGGPALRDGSVIPRERTRLPVDVQDLLDSLESVLADVPPPRLRGAVGRLSAALSGRESEIEVVLEALGRLARTFARVAPSQRRLLDNATAAGDAFLDTREDLARAVAAADRVLAGIGDEPAELEELFAANDRLARRGVALLARRRAELARGIGALADFASMQKRRSEVFIDQTLDWIPAFLRAIEHAAIPWEDPDGRRFYRIRAGLVVDDDPASWPCKYRLPDEYERFHWQREARRVVTDVRCEAATPGRELVSALARWAAVNPGELERLLAGSEGASPGVLLWPLDGPVTSLFGPRWGRMHTGIDIDGEAGEPVTAAAAGRVVAASWIGGYGNTVVIDHGGGMSTLYAHLSAVAVVPGQRVRAGQLLGLVGCTGSCTGDHLHFEVRVGGVPVDPLGFLVGGALYSGAGDAPPQETGLPPAPPQNEDAPRDPGGRGPGGRPGGRPGEPGPGGPGPGDRPSPSPSPTPSPSGSPPATPGPSPSP